MASKMIKKGLTEDGIAEIDGIEGKITQEGSKGNDGLGVLLFGDNFHYFLCF